MSMFGKIKNPGAKNRQLSEHEAQMSLEMVPEVLTMGRKLTFNNEHSPRHSDRGYLT